MGEKLGFNGIDNGYICLFIEYFSEINRINRGLNLDHEETCDPFCTWQVRCFPQGAYSSWESAQQNRWRHSRRTIRHAVQGTYSKTSHPKLFLGRNVKNMHKSLYVSICYSKWWKIKLYIKLRWTPRKMSVNFFDTNFFYFVGPNKRFGAALGALSGGRVGIIGMSTSNLKRLFYFTALLSSEEAVRTSSKNEEIPVIEYQLQVSECRKMYIQTSHNVHCSMSYLQFDAFKIYVS